MATIPYITQPLSAANLNSIMNWLIAQINSAIGGTSGTALYAGPAIGPNPGGPS